MKALLPQPEGGNFPVEFFGLTDEQAENRRFRKRPSGLTNSTLNHFCRLFRLCDHEINFEPVTKFKIKQSHIKVKRMLQMESAE